MLEILKNLNLEVVVKKPETYLDNRFQCTEIADIKSFLLNVTCRCAPGISCWPLLFLIYVKDIVKAFNFNTVLYANDINLHILVKNPKTG